MSLFGYSDEETRRISELRAALDLLRAAGALSDPLFAHAYRDDLAVLAKAMVDADAGDLKAEDLQALEISVRRVMWAWFEKTKDPRFGGEKRPQGGQLEDANAWARGGAAVDDAEKAVKKAAEAADDVVDAAKQAIEDAIKRKAAEEAADAIPVEYKVAAGVAAALLFLLILVKA